MKFLRSILRYKDIFLLCLVLAGALVLSFQDVVFFDEVFIERDISRYYYPLRYFVTNSLRSGEIPFWNPYLFCGIPLFATLQSCVFYPLSAIYYIGEYYRMFGFFILSHFVLAGLFMYILMKDMGLSRLGSSFAAIVFAFSGYLASTINLTINIRG